MFARLLIGTALTAAAVSGAVAVLAAPGSVLACVGFGGVVAAIVGQQIRRITPGEAAAKKWTGRRAGVLVGCVAAAGGLALIGLILLLGPASAAVVLVVVLVTSAVWVRHQPDRRAALTTNPLPAVMHDVLRVVLERMPFPPGAAPTSARAVVAAESPEPEPEPEPGPWSAVVAADLSVSQLCAAWQRTYVALLDLPAGAPRQAVVRLRTELLDEIERRNPEGFIRWLDTGARAGGDPSRYLTGDR